MSRIYDNWERLVAAVLKREQFREMALAPPSAESSFRSSRQSDLSSFASSNRHDELVVGNDAAEATPAGIAARATLLLTAPIAYFRRRIQKDHSFDFPDPFFGAVYLDHLERLSLHKLKVATDNFSNRNIIGRGGFGQVYKGRLADGMLVAVKRLKKEFNKFGELQFQNEVETSSHAFHRNLLRLHGFCVSQTERLLVYPYMVNGSVASCLREREESKPPLDWPIRKLIALGSAKGIAYLHDQCGKQIIHGDVKAANIFLDEDFEAVVGDFGLATLVDPMDSRVATAVRGTIGHIAPENTTTCTVSEKTDVYGYGVMLLELITGQRAFDLDRSVNRENFMLVEWVREHMREKKLESLVDTYLKDGYNEKEVEELIQVALLCTQNSPGERPKMSDVVGMLQGNDLAERRGDWQKEGEMLRQMSDITHYSTDWIIADSIYNNMQADELSGPR